MTEQINEAIGYLNNTIDHVNLLPIYSALYPTSAEHTFFSHTYGIQWEINEVHMEDKCQISKE